MSADVTEHKHVVNKVYNDALTVPIASHGDCVALLDGMMKSWNFTTKTPELFVPFLELSLFSILLNFTWWQELLGLVFSIRRPRWPFWAMLIIYTDR